MSKPRPTIADYMVIALSPALIIALVGSLCFFLIDVFYHGQLEGSVRWVLFWFVIGSVLVSRIAIEKSTQHAIIYGLGLAMATWLYLLKTQPSFYFIGAVLLAVVWFCAHKLVWDCTLIDEEQDASGQGLLQKAPAAPAPEQQQSKKLKKKIAAPHSPGRWVIYFSLAALPLFGIGQKLLPGDATAEQRAGLMFLAVYLAAALGLLVTTSFLGLRRYLRQRYLRMSPTIALAWLKYGIGVACIVLIGAVFLPRPGANEAWAALRYQIDYQVQQASKYAMRSNPPGKGEGRAGDESGGKQGDASKSGQEQGNKSTAGGQKTGEAQSSPQNSPAPSPSIAPAGQVYNFLRAAIYIVGILIIGGWIIRQRGMLLEMVRSIANAIAQFFRKLFDLTPAWKPAKRPEPAFVRPKLSSFAEYRNPFFAAKDYAWPPEEIIIYTYEAVQVWAKEQGIPAQPEETAREFCARLGQSRQEFDSHFNELARLYAHAAYGPKLPPNSDLEPIRDLWRRLPTTVRVAA